MKIMVINGPNIDMLGIREPDIYGENTYANLLEMLKEYAEEKNIDIVPFQSNIEGEIVNAIHTAYFDGCELLIAADCTAYAYASIHEDFMRGKITLIGCPKLDAVDYSQKLAAIFAQNDVRSVTLLRMEVPCCGGLEFAAKKAIAESGKELSLRVVTISIEGEILEDA